MRERRTGAEVRCSGWLLHCDSCRKIEATKFLLAQPFPSSPPCAFPVGVAAPIAAAGTRQGCLRVVGFVRAATAAGCSAGRLVPQLRRRPGGVPAGTRAARRADASLAGVGVIYDVQVRLQVMPVGQGDVEAHCRVLQVCGRDVPVLMTRA